MSASKPRCSKNQVRWQYAGIASDHGKRRSSCSSVEVSPSFGSSCKRNSRYPNGSSPLRLAVSIILKHNALASAPLAVSQNRKFFRDITKGFTVRSAILFVRVRRPSMRTLSYACRWFKEYVLAFPKLESLSSSKLFICFYIVFVLYCLQRRVVYYSLELLYAHISILGSLLDCNAAFSHLLHKHPEFASFFALVYHFLNSFAHINRLRVLWNIPYHNHFNTLQ